MSKRLLDILFSIVALVAALPLLILAAVGIRLSSPGPVLYRARRIARDRREGRSDKPMAHERRQPGYQGREFTMYKLRTMHVSSGEAMPITARHDTRVFAFGAFLRATKIDELPQLINVLLGDMALVGPRPEAPEIVRRHYLPEDITTLRVHPGLTSPGALFYYTHCEDLLQGGSHLDLYVQRLLPVKLAIDRVYIRDASVFYDVRVLFRTLVVVAARAVGSRRFADPPELTKARVNLKSPHGL